MTQYSPEELAELRAIRGADYEPDDEGESSEDIATLALAQSTPPAPHPSWANERIAGAVEAFVAERAPEIAAGFGHNSGDVVAQIAGDANNLTQAARDKLRLTVAKIEKLEEEIREVQGQKKDVYAEAKAMGYDTKTIRTVIARRRLDRQDREERDAILDTYEMALGEI